MDKVPEIIMHYNAYDKRYFIYRGEDYVYDSQDTEKALNMFKQCCETMNQWEKKNRLLAASRGQQA